MFQQRADDLVCWILLRERHGQLPRPAVVQRMRGPRSSGKEVEQHLLGGASGRVIGEKCLQRVGHRQMKLLISGKRAMLTPKTKTFFRALKWVA